MILVLCNHEKTDAEGSTFVDSIRMVQTEELYEDGIVYIHLECPQCKNHVELQVGELCANDRIPDFFPGVRYKK